MGRGWFVVLIVNLSNMIISYGQNYIYENKISNDSIIENINDVKKLNNYLNKVNSLDLDEHYRNSYDYSVFLFTAGLALDSNDFNPLSYFEKALNILENSNSNYFDEKCMNHFFIAKSYLKFSENKLKYHSHTEKAFKLLKYVSENFSNEVKGKIQFHYISLLYNKKNYRNALELLLQVENNMTQLYKDSLTFLKANIFDKLNRDEDELSVRELIYSNSYRFSNYFEKYNESTRKYITLLLKRENYQLAKVILEVEFENFKLLENDISKFEFFSNLIVKKEQLNLKKHKVSYLERCLKKNFKDLEGLVHEEYSSKLNSLIGKGLYLQALDVNEKQYQWYLINEIKNAYFFAVLLNFDTIYKNINGYESERKENIQLIFNLIENDKTFFDKIGVRGYEIPIIAHEIGFEKLSQKYLIEYFESQMNFFDAILRSNDENTENWILVFSEIINEILSINLEQNFIIDKYLIYCIELLNQFEYNINAPIHEIREKLSIKKSTKENYDSVTLFFREYYDYNKKEFRAVIYYIGIFENNFFLISKENYSLLNIWKQNILNKTFLKNFFEKIKKTSSIFIVSSGLDSYMNFNVFKKEFEILNKSKLRIVNVYSLQDIINYKDLKLKSDWSIELYGDIDYDENYKNINTNSNNGIYNKKWSYLPGSYEEINIIAQLANKKNISFNIYSGENVRVDAINYLTTKKNPYILHIATHGFFLDKKPENNFMYPSKLWEGDSKLDRSGIILSGGNNVWFSNTLDPSNRDAILTANEIKNLNFKNCKLVILSSCYSGRADISTPNNILGLQTALRVAGVNKMIVSNFEISDNKSPIFFEYFYSELFKGKSIHSAFTNTQKEMRKRYGFEDDFWTSFILLE